MSTRVLIKTYHLKLLHELNSAILQNSFLSESAQIVTILQWNSYSKNEGTVMGDTLYFVVETWHASVAS